MRNFSADWLALREPADRRARSSRLARAIADALGLDSSLNALDLASGTGSNVRYLAGLLPARQCWLLLDQDPTLLAQVPAQMSSWGTARGHQVMRETNGLLLRGEHLTCHLATRCVDLATLDDASILDGRALVTASALLDLVSEYWLSALADRCRASGAAVLFALTYDGRTRCSPEEEEDDMVRDLVNRHQRTDKGFGVGLGPDAASSAERCFARLGYAVRREPSDWVLRSDSRDLQYQLIAGWAEAATAVAPARSASIEGWRTRRFEHVAHNRSRLVVGHEDLAAWLPEAGAAGERRIQTAR